MGAMMQINGWMDWLAPKLATPGDFLFFRMVLRFLREKIQAFGIQLMSNVMTFVGMIALTVLTIWVLVQGYRIVTGQSRDAMMGLVVNATKATLIVGIATSMAMFGTGLHEFLTKDLTNHITLVVTDKDKGPASQIDESLGWMQVALSSVDTIDVVQDSTLDSEKTRAMWMMGLGMGGPALIGGSLLLMYEVALALFIGLGPIFILCLLFESTKQMFHKWLWYGIGTMFSMAVLAAMVSISLDLVIRVAGAFWANAAIGKLLLVDGMSDGISSQALQQGGMGLILTTLMISTPPMAAMFFQGTLANFSSYNQMQSGNSNQPPGTPGYQPAPLGQQPNHMTVQQNQAQSGTGYDRVTQVSSPPAQESIPRTDSRITQRG